MCPRRKWPKPGPISGPSKIGPRSCPTDPGRIRPTRTASMEIGGQSWTDPGRCWTTRLANPRLAGMCVWCGGTGTRFAHVYASLPCVARWYWKTPERLDPGRLEADAPTRGWAVGALQGVATGDVPWPVCDLVQLEEVLDLLGRSSHRPRRTKSGADVRDGTSGREPMGSESMPQNLFRASTGQLWPRNHQSWCRDRPSLARLRPTLAEFGRLWATFGRERAGFGPLHP